MLKSKKRFVLSSETVNSYGFRVLTEGINLDQFKRNPLMLWMHHRAITSDKNQILPIGHWEDIVLKGGTLYGTPVFDDTDSFATSIYSKVENGTLKMASAGLLPIEWSEDASYMLAGQKKPTLMKSILQEVSIVDVGANSDALAQTLYDLNGGKVNLSTLGANYAFEIKGSSKSSAASVNLLLSTALKQNKILVSEMPYLKKLAIADFETVKVFFEGKRDGCALTAGLINRSWTELDVSGGLVLLNKYEPAIYKEKFFEQFGKYPKQ